MARPGDARQLATLYRDSARYHTGIDPALYVVPDADALAAAYADTLTSTDVGVFVAEVGERPVGCVEVQILRPSGSPTMIRPRVVADVGIAVVADHRRSGIGTRLMEAAETWARSKGAQMMILNCHAANTAAVRFYEKLGYRIRGLFMDKPLPITHKVEN